MKMVFLSAGASLALGCLVGFGVAAYVNEAETFPRYGEPIVQHTHFHEPLDGTSVIQTPEYQISLDEVAADDGEAILQITRTLREHGDAAVFEVSRDGGGQP